MEIKMKLLLIGIFLLSCSDSSSDSRRVEYPDSFWVGKEKISSDSVTYTTWLYCTKSIEDCINDSLKDCDLASFVKEYRAVYDSEDRWLVNCAKIEEQYCGHVALSIRKPSDQHYIYHVMENGKRVEKKMYLSDPGATTGQVCCTSHGCTRTD